MSKFAVYSVGIVAGPINPLGSKIASIFPIEIMPFADGEVKSNPTTISDSGVDKDGKPYTIEVVADNTIEAEWIAMGSENRETPPDVRRGERVLIYRYEDSDKFYWTSLGLDKGLRRLETMLIRFSAHTDESNVTLTDENSYWLEVSSHKKSVTFATSLQNGEKAAYGLKFDMENGTFTLKDNKDNHIFLDSLNALIEIENTDKSLVRLDKKTILIKSTDSITLDTKDVIVNGSSKVAVTTKDHSVDADNSKFTLKSFVAKASTFVVTAATSIKGKFAATGGSFTHEGVDVGKDHVHIGTKPGSPGEMSGKPKP